MMALQSSDSLKIRKDPVRQKNKGGHFSISKKSHQFQRATFHTNNIHYNKYVTIKTQAKIISNGLTVRGSPLPKNRGATFQFSRSVQVQYTQLKFKFNIRDVQFT